MVGEVVVASSPVWDCLIHGVGDSARWFRRKAQDSRYPLLFNGGGAVDQTQIIQNNQLVFTL